MRGCASVWRMSYTCIYIEKAILLYDINNDCCASDASTRVKSRVQQPIPRGKFFTSPPPALRGVWPEDIARFTRTPPCTSIVLKHGPPLARFSDCQHKAETQPICSTSTSSLSVSPQEITELLVNGTPIQVLDVSSIYYILFPSYHQQTCIVLDL